MGLSSWRFLIEAVHDALVELQDSAFCRLNIPVGGRRLLEEVPPASYIKTLYAERQKEPSQKNISNIRDKAAS